MNKTDLFTVQIKQDLQDSIFLSPMPSLWQDYVWGIGNEFLKVQLKRFSDRPGNPMTCDPHYSFQFLKSGKPKCFIQRVSDFVDLTSTVREIDAYGRICDL